MQLVMNCHNDPAYEDLLDNLIQEVFGFSFKPWFEKKLWTENYESYSLIDQGCMLANVCIYKTDMLLGGKPFHANQFGAVATRESMRGKGLSRRLMMHVLDKYPETPAFLAANPSVIDFYPKFGFRRVKIHRPVVKTNLDQDACPAHKLQLDDELLLRAIYEKRCYSQVLDSINTQSIQQFHLLMEYSDDIYYLPGCEAVLIAQQEKSRLWIADIISSQPVNFTQIIRELPFSGIDRIEFGFCPDWLEVTPEWLAVDQEKQPFYLKGDWPLPEYFRFSALSET